MAICKDPSLTYLNSSGYNVVKLPRTGIEPMLVLGKRSSLELLGKLSSIWKTTAPEPIPGPPIPVAELDGKKSDKLELSIGLKMLANVLQGLGLGGALPSLDFAFTRARKVQFTYSNVTSTSIMPLDAGNYLASGDLNTNNPLVEAYFLGDDGDAFLIVDVLKSDTLTVTASAEDGTDVKLDVPAIQGLVGGKIGVQSGNAGDSTISFKGPTAIAFGFKAFGIAFQNGKWSLVGVKPSGDMAFAVGDEGSGDSAGVLFTTTGLTNL
jgi:hypothetical protein